MAGTCGVFILCRALREGLCVEDLTEALQQHAVLGTLMSPLYIRGGKTGGLVSCRAHCWEVVALGLNPTRPLPATTTLPSADSQ